MRLLGCDVSLYQDNNNTPQKTDFQKMKEGGMNFVFIKIGQGKYADPDFYDNWRLAEDAGMIRGGYWFNEYRPGLDPGILAQADKCLETLDGNFGELGVAFDFERPNGEWPPLPSKQVSLNRISTFMVSIEDATKEDTIFYSNLNTIKNHLTIKGGEWICTKPLWMAQYPNLVFDYIPPITVNHTPVPWKVNFWQFTDRLDGYKYGVESKQLDGNFFYGTYEELRTFRKRNLPELTDKQKLDILWNEYLKNK